MFKLSAYKKAYSKLKGISQEKIRTAVGYAGLRKRINTGEIDYELDDKQPSRRSYDTFSKRIKKLIRWKNNPEEFIEELLKENREETLYKEIKKQIKKERNQEKSIS